MVMNFAMSLMMATVMMEAGNQPFPCQRLVAATIHNRAVYAMDHNPEMSYNRAVVEAILKKKQFSCWNGTSASGIANVYKMAELSSNHKMKSYIEMLPHLIKTYSNINITQRYLEGGVRWYHRVDVHPKWSLSESLVPYCTCGDHVFYREVLK